VKLASFEVGILLHTEQALAVRFKAECSKVLSREKGEQEQASQKSSQQQEDRFASWSARRHLGIVARQLWQPRKQSRVRGVMQRKQQRTYMHAAP
jgi:hypothetical protein